jgi:chemotaxis methyl-accepting protein methylase
MEIIELLLKSKNIDFSKFETTFFLKTLKKRMDFVKCDSFDSYYLLLLNDFEEINLLQDSLQINYSEFFRNSLTFSVLEKIVLPHILIKKEKSKRKEIRIWTAASAGGQESYSLAILMEELVNRNDYDINYRIFATDISANQINYARNGIYSEPSINNITHSRLKKWFDYNGEFYVVRDELKNKIEFSIFDLFNKKFSSPQDSIFGDFDLVFCANILFYYKPEFQSVIIEKLSNTLRSEGYLITGETEREILKQNNFKEVFLNSAIFKN